MAQNFKNFWRRKTKKATILGWIIQKSLKNEKQNLVKYREKILWKAKKQKLMFSVLSKNKKAWEIIFIWKVCFFQASVREFFKDWVNKLSWSLKYKTFLGIVWSSLKWLLYGNKE